MKKKIWKRLSQAQMKRKNKFWSFVSKGLLNWLIKTSFKTQLYKEKTRLQDLHEFQVRDILLSRIHEHLTKYSRIIFVLVTISGTDFLILCLETRDRPD